ncbi:hypothetical protein CONCODRAFT_10237 [Conidiobolus coronatus NRRL 28638]|uniref:Uncharacterized protein n=1 Tax=Conidiobolus coronatus (strain ATCC 28846 / CBS 209.66 / NRRL 28638) TaxID=796925 RepID=A0A137NXX5_CONC2|nr:hypothetical protein CONCODRAFT_10237 [Conidiobolus coronatus NRRL 28638]|eukprot:KXN67645.1 hypothetical protein CONCODRAFT_10237 [Conidiobolus coronatus NRRL 28638]
MNLKLSTSTLFLLINLVLGEFDECPIDPTTINCDPDFDPTFATMTATVYSENDFKGDSKTFEISGVYGCYNIYDNIIVKSVLSTASTQLTFHYGYNCAGHVIKQVQGGFANNTKPVCAGSLFIKLNRYGSC